MLQLLKFFFFIIVSISVTTCKMTKGEFNEIVVAPSAPVSIDYEVTGNLTKNLFLKYRIGAA
jgi:hypothetical protein